MEMDPISQGPSICYGWLTLLCCRLMAFRFLKLTGLTVGYILLDFPAVFCDRIYTSWDEWQEHLRILPFLKSWISCKSFCLGLPQRALTSRSHTNTWRLFVSHASRCISTCQYPLFKSRAVNSMILSRDSRFSWIVGMGYASAQVLVFSFLYSAQNLGLTVFQTMGDAYGADELFIFVHQSRII